MSEREIFQIHQASDRQPAFDASGALQGGCCTTRLKLTNPKIKNSANPNVEQQEGKLKSTTHELRAIPIGTTNKLLFRRYHWMRLRLNWRGEHSSRHFRTRSTFHSAIHFDRSKERRVGKEGR